MTHIKKSSKLKLTFITIVILMLTILYIGINITDPPLDINVASVINTAIGLVLILVIFLLASFETKERPETKHYKKK